MFVSGYKPKPKMYRSDFSQNAFRSLRFTHCYCTCVVDLNISANTYIKNGIINVIFNVCALQKISAA